MKGSTSSPDRSINALFNAQPLLWTPPGESSPMLQFRTASAAQP
jgi:hypothetical protein